MRAVCLPSWGASVVQQQQEQHSTPSSENLRRVKRQARSYLFSAAIAWSLSLVVLAGGLFIGLYAWDQRQAALTRQSEQLAAASQAALEEGDATRATLLALEALPDPDQRTFLNRPMIPAAEGALYAAVSEMTERRKYEGLLDTGKGQAAHVAAFGRLDGKVQIVDVLRDRNLASFDFENFDLADLSLSPNGTRLLTLSATEELSVWDTESGARIDRAQLELGASHVWAELLYGSELVLIDGSDRKTARHSQRLFDLKSKTFLDLSQTIGSIEYTDLSFSQLLPDWLLVFGEDDKFVLVHCESRETLSVTDDAFEFYPHMSVSADRNYLAIAGSVSKGDTEEETTQTTIFVIDLETRRQISKLDGHTEWISSIAIDSKTRRLISATEAFGGHETEVFLWNLDTNEKLAETAIEGLRGKVRVRFLKETNQIGVLATNYHAAWDSTLSNTEVRMPTGLHRLSRYHEWPDMTGDVVVGGKEGAAYFARRSRFSNRTVKTGGRPEVKLFPQSDRAVVFMRNGAYAYLTTRHGHVSSRIALTDERILDVSHRGELSTTIAETRDRNLYVFNRNKSVNGFPLHESTGSFAPSFSQSRNDGRVFMRARYNDTAWKNEIVSISDNWSITRADVADIPRRRLKFGQTSSTLTGYTQKGDVLYSYDLTSEKLSKVADTSILRNPTYWPLQGDNEFLFMGRQSRNSTPVELYLNDPDGGLDLSPFALPTISSWRSIAVSDDGRLVAAANAEKFVVWNASKKQLVISEPLNERSDSRPFVRISKDGNVAAMLERGQLTAWNTRTGEKTTVRSTVTNETWGEVLVVGNTKLLLVRHGWPDSRFGKNILWDWTTDQVVSNYRDLKKMRRIETDRMERYLLGQEGDAAVLWELETGRTLRKWRDVVRIEFGYNGTYTICACADQLAVHPILPRGNALIELARQNLPPHRNSLSDEERCQYGLSSGH